MVWLKVPSLPSLMIAILLLANVQGCSTGLPECDSSSARQTLEKAMNEAQWARAMYLSVVDISGARERSGSDKRKECTADVLMNNLSEVQVKYTMNLRGSEGYILRFEVVGGMDSLSNR